jgi:hypothetical protein
MLTNPNPESRNYWLWLICGLGLLAGMTLGLRAIRVASEPLPILTSITAPEPLCMKLDHPLSGGVTSAGSTGSLRIWLYAGRELAGPPLAEVVQSPIFDYGTSWLGGFINEKLDHNPNNFSAKMRGWVAFPMPRTMVRIRSDNGFRIRFRNAVGKEQTLEHWVDDVTDDFAFCAVAEPGMYEIEIDYFNGVGGYYFGVSFAPKVELVPAVDSNPDAR